jgi:hypothetical protein
MILYFMKFENFILLTLFTHIIYNRTITKLRLICLFSEFNCFKHFIDKILLIFGKKILLYFFNYYL